MTTPLHDWMRPRLEALLADAKAAGYERAAAVAVMVDLVAEDTTEVAPDEPQE